MRSLSFRIWFPFAVFSSLMMLVIAYYYSSKQEELYIENRRFELQELSKSVALAVELSLENENMQGLKKALDLAKSSEDFEKVAVVVSDGSSKKQLFANPEGNNLDILNLDEEKYILEKFPFKTEVLSGEIYMVSSKEKIDTVISELNYPVFVILSLIVLISLVAFYIFAKWTVSPINNLIKFSKAIEDKEHFNFDFEKSTIEISELALSLKSLSDNLNIERHNNENILSHLEEQVEKRTKENKQLSLVAKHALNGVLIADKDRRIVWANQSLLNITGYTLEELIGQTPKIFQFEKTDQQTIARINDSLAKNEIVKEQVLNKGKHGREYWLELNIVPVFEKDEVTSYIAVETEITDRILDDQKLRKSEEQNRRILENAAELIHTLDNNGNIIWANRSWLQNIGISEEEIKGRNILEFLDSNTKEEFLEVIPRLMNGEVVDDLNCVLVSKTNENLELRGKTIPLIENGKVIGSQAYLHNVTQIVSAQKKLKEKSLLQDLIMRISTKYINFPEHELRQTVLESLRDIANFVSADRAYIFDYHVEEGYCEYMYEWTAPGIREQMNDYKRINLDTMPYWYGKHSNKEFVIVEDRKSVMDENIKQLLVTEGIKSLITIPIHDENKLVGFVGFDLIKKSRKFSEEEKEILVLFSKMLINVYNKMAYINALNESKKKIENVNASLEQRVAENTKKNIDLSKSIIEQEKFATIGEISAGIAHDLNTPLGTIKVGADNVRFMISTILNHNLSILSKNELETIKHRIETVETEMYVGGLQLRREKQAMMTFVSEMYPGWEGQKLDQITDLIVKSRLSTNDVEFINGIFASSDPLLYVDILYQVHMATAQLETIKKSSDKAVKVVQDVRAFIKGEASQNIKRRFNLRDNISTVLGVFNYDLRKNVDLNFEVDPTIELEGYDVKLFQLWSNLVKNAFEAMDEQEEKYIGIFSSVSGDKLKITFENNGPMIPQEVQENMFKKFYTTKSKKSGSGLGLSIVKNILIDHNASIEVLSDEQVTKFIVTFDLNGRN
jgi:PAS domain S-box-containing protein